MVTRVKKPGKIEKGKNLADYEITPEFRRKLIDLRIRGYSFQAIADWCAKPKEQGGLGRKMLAQTVYIHISRGLEDARKNYSESASELLNIEVQRLDRLITALEKFCVPPDAVQTAESEAEVEALFKPSIKAMEQLEKLLDRKARLLGFYRAAESSNTKEALPWSDEE